MKEAFWSVPESETGCWTAGDECDSRRAMKKRVAVTARQSGASPTPIDRRSTWVYRTGRCQCGSLVHVSAWKNDAGSVTPVRQSE